LSMSVVEVDSSLRHSRCFTFLYHSSRVDFF
jgi:hypothetical protein